MSLFTKFTSDVNRAFGIPLDPKKKITTLLTDQKAELESLRQYMKDSCTETETLKDWGKVNGSDVSCVLNYLGEIEVEMRKVLNNYIKACNVQINDFKEIKQDEKELKALKDTEKELSIKVDENYVKGKETLEKVEENYSIAKKAYEVKILEHDAFVREKLYKSYEAKFDAMKEFAQKLDILASFGKCVVNQFPQGTIPYGSEKPEFTGEPTLKEIVNDAKEAVSQWTKESMLEE